MSPLDPTPPRRVRLAMPDGGFVAADVVDGGGPPLVFLGGYGSDMLGTKASWLVEQCTIWGWHFIRFDYRGRGASSGVPTDGSFDYGTLSRHLEDTLAVLDQLTDRPAILIGSSMGGWLMLQVAKRHPERVAALVGIAAAPDFTTYLDNDPGEYVPPDFIEDANAHILGDAPIGFADPVALLHGLRDDVVRSEISSKTARLLASDDVTVTFIKDADHSLSRPQDLQLLWQTLARLRDQVMTAG